MAKYRLSNAAKNDLFEIAIYGDENFGISQSNVYRDQLKAHFSRLAEQPKLYAAVNDIRKGYRRSVCGVHSIYYKIEGQGVLIVRVLRAQNIETAF